LGREGTGDQAESQRDREDGFEHGRSRCANRGCGSSEISIAPNSKSDGESARMLLFWVAVRGEASSILVY
jgi:hypothetical protein